MTRTILVAVLACCGACTHTVPTDDLALVAQESRTAENQRAVRGKAIGVVIAAPGVHDSFKAKIDGHTYRVEKLHAHLGKAYEELLRGAASVKVLSERSGTFDAYFVPSTRLKLDQKFMKKRCIVSFEVKVVDRDGSTLAVARHESSDTFRAAAAGAIACASSLKTSFSVATDEVLSKLQQQE